MTRTTSLPTFAIVTVGLAASLVAQDTTPRAAQPPDVIGLRLGMTEPQAVAALRAYNPSVQIRAVADTLPTPAATRFTATLYAGVFGDDRAGIGDELIRLDFTNPTPVPRLLGISRRQAFPPGRELTLTNTLAAFRDKYGPPRFTRTAPRQTVWLWAAGVDPRAQHPPSGCSRVTDNLSEPPNVGIVVGTMVEPRAYFHSPECGVAIEMGAHEVGGLVRVIATTLLDFPAGVRAREELDEMQQAARSQAGRSGPARPAETVAHEHFRSISLESQRPLTVW